MQDLKPSAIGIVIRMVGERYALGQIQADPLNDADRFAVGGWP